MRWIAHEMRLRDQFYATDAPWAVPAEANRPQANAICVGSAWDHAHKRQRTGIDAATTCGRVAEQNVPCSQKSAVGQRWTWVCVLTSVYKLRP